MNDIERADVMKKSILELNRNIVLATASEARRKLVYDLGLDPILDSVEIDESALPGEEVSEYVRRLATSKAKAVIPPSLDSVIIAVDTAIGAGNEIIGKPKEADDARRILKKLSGKQHDVLSAIALRDMECDTTDVETTHTKVEFLDLTDEMIDWYISTEEWKNRAGAYAIQGKGMCIIKSIEGCLTNVIGISIPSLLRMLTRIV